MDGPQAVGLDHLQVLFSRRQADGWMDGCADPASQGLGPGLLPFPGKHISSCSDSPSAPWPVGISTTEGVFQEVGMWGRKALMAPRWPPRDSSGLRALLVSTSCKVPPAPRRGAAEQKSPAKRDDQVRDERHTQAASGEHLLVDAVALGPGLLPADVVSPQGT